MRLIKLTVLAASMGVAGMAAAADNFAGVTWGESTSNYDSSKRLQQQMPGAKMDDVIKNSGTWGVRAGRDNGHDRVYLTYEQVSDDYHSTVKLRQENLLGSYDRTFSVTDSARLYAGVTGGMTKVSQESKGYSRDTGYGYAIGAQVGGLLALSQAVELEAGFRYLKHNADVDFKERGVGRTGNAELSSSKQSFLGVNVKF